MRHDTQMRLEIVFMERLKPIVFSKSHLLDYMGYKIYYLSENKPKEVILHMFNILICLDIF